ncbi:MAG: hypothetical protein LBP22_01645 [Deltaproteobacteria bacterium]|jgi:hypothetical protein|nr:hypothetical protein [Deltaproteobacteria bacterium]
MPVRLFGKDALEAEVIADTTVQEKYTNSWLTSDCGTRYDVWNLCLRIAAFYKIKLCRTYAKALKQLKKEINFSKGRKTKKFKNAALRNLRSYVNKVLKDLKNKIRKNSHEAFEHPGIAEFFENANKAVTQQKNDKNKIYSIFESLKKGGKNEGKKKTARHSFPPGS